MQINSTTFAPAKFANIGTLLNLITPLLMVGAAVIFLVMLIMGAFTYLMAGDNPENVKKAQKTLMFSVVGLVIVISAYLIMKIIGYIFKFPLIF